MRELIKALKVFNDATLFEELRVAGGSYFEGWRTEEDRMYLILNAAIPQEVEDAVVAAYDAHNPSVLAPSQVLAARRAAAEHDLRAADFKQTLQAINALAIPQEAKVVLRQILLLQYKSALATGIIDTPDPTQ